MKQPFGRSLTSKIIAKTLTAAMLCVLYAFTTRVLLKKTQRWRAV
ncbi:MAG: hypothetical protein NWQ13_02755 [Glaciimonas sp.]|nr:hypothetical protein [Glaciimonas sp.]